MNELLTLMLALVVGALLGAMFFGGLWWTVRTGVASRRPALLFLGSLLLRTSVAVTGFYLVSGGHWERLLLSLLGFITARHIVSWLTRSPLTRSPLTQSPQENQTQPAQEASHAP